MATQSYGSQAPRIGTVKGNGRARQPKPTGLLASAPKKPKARGAK